MSHSLETLSDRLLHALNALNITQAHLARKINVKPQAINYLCKNKTKKSQLTYDIAEALGINGEWLAHGVGYMHHGDDPQYKLYREQNRVPLLTNQQIKQFSVKKFQSFPDEAKLKWMLTSSNSGKKGFAMIMQDKSMYPRLDQGTSIIINQEQEAKNKDFVLAYINSIEDLILRQIEFHKEQIILKPLNTSFYKKITLQKEDAIVGVLVEARWQM